MKMKIAVPITAEKYIDSHFGQCESYGVEVVRGCSGKADDVVKLFIDGLVKDSGSSCHQHESHHQNGHECSHS